MTAGAALSTATMVAPRPVAANGYLQPVFNTPRSLPGAAGATEPRLAIAPDGTIYAISASNTSNGTTAPVSVYSSHDRGATWKPTAGMMSGQNTPSPDVDIVVTRTGRIVATELDAEVLSVIISYSDDGGASWTTSSGANRLADQDRPWLAVGPDDPGTHQPRVYLLFHNGFSASATENMFVETSTDNGSTFGPPVPLTTPGTEPFLDLQCADSSGPSNLVVNAKTGRIYAFWNTRHDAIGGCANLPVMPYTIVAATRTWVATSPDNSVGSWTNSLAVDDSATGNIVGMQLAPGALDTAGNVYVVYPESPNPYPDFTGAAVRMRWSTADLGRWSSPVTIAPTGQPGNVLTHVVAGDPGRLDVAYFAGAMTGGDRPKWYMTVRQVQDALSSSPLVSAPIRVSSVPALTGTASQLEDVCDAGPAGVVNNNPVTCNRAADVWGITLDAQCNLVLSWGTLSPQSQATLGASVDATWVATQAGGPSLCASSTGSARADEVAAPAPMLPSTGGSGSLVATLILAGISMLCAKAIASARRAS